MVKGVRINDGLMLSYEWNICITLSKAQGGFSFFFFQKGRKNAGARVNGRVVCGKLASGHDRAVALLNSRLP